LLLRALTVELGAPLRVFDATTADDLGVSHVPLPVELADEFALEDDALPFEIVAIVESPPARKSPRS
jgi:hypothetical protein